MGVVRLLDAQGEWQSTSDTMVAASTHSMREREREREGGREGGREREREREHYVYIINVIYIHCFTCECLDPLMTLQS